VTNLILFSHNHQEIIHTTFSNATVRHYPPGYFQLGQDHDFDFTYDGERSFIGGLNILVQFAEDNRCQHIYIIDQWNDKNITMARLSGYYPVMIELSEDNIDKINQLAIQHMFYDGVKSSLASAIFPDKLLGSNDAFSAIAIDINNQMKIVRNSHLGTMNDMVIDSIRRLYL